MQTLGRMRHHFSDVDHRLREDSDALVTGLYFLFCTPPTSRRGSSYSQVYFKNKSSFYHYLKVYSKMYSSLCEFSWKKKSKRGRGHRIRRELGCTSPPVNLRRSSSEITM